MYNVIPTKNRAMLARRMIYHAERSIGNDDLCPLSEDHRHRWRGIVSAPVGDVLVAGLPFLQEEEMLTTEKWCGEGGRVSPHDVHLRVDASDNT
jgi:hypothetical protein